jgi:hypothetical protein
VTSKRNSILYNRALNPVEEELVLKEILGLDARGFSLNHATVREMASVLLRARTGKGVS